MRVTLPTRLNTFVTRVLDGGPQQRPAAPVRSGTGSAQGRHPRAERKDFSYYMRMVDSSTGETIGHLADISTGGFKLDCQLPVPVNQEVRFLMNVPGEIAGKPEMVFGARSRWCKADPLNPTAYNVGYQLTEISPEDLEILVRMMESYGRETDKRSINLRRSYKW